MNSIEKTQAHESWRAFFEMLQAGCAEYNEDVTILAAKIYQSHIGKSEQLRLEENLQRKSPAVFITISVVTKGKMPEYAEAKKLEIILRDTLRALSNKSRATTPVTTFVHQSSLHNH